MDNRGVVSCRRGPIVRKHPILLNSRFTLSRIATEGLSRTGHFFLNVNSVYVSSYVHLKTSPDIFGRINFIFEHTFNCHVHALVCVHWYGNATKDVGSGLLHVNTNTRSTAVSSVVHLRDISKPLMHAVDELTPAKLWILNHVS